MDGAVARPAEPFAGRLRRKFSLDQYPQLVKVVQDRMNLVDPRPPAIAHSDMYRKLIDGYMVRHKAMPASRA